MGVHFHDIAGLHFSVNQVHFIGKNPGMAVHYNPLADLLLKDRFYHGAKVTHFLTNYSQVYILLPGINQGFLKLHP
jgi:hypothetical protein